MENILSIYTNKGISQKELCILSLDYLSDYEFKPDPPTPFLLVQYRQKKKEDPTYKVKVSFWKQEEIEKYHKERDTRRCDNYGNYRWLNIMLTHMDDEEIKTKINNILARYPAEYGEYYGKNKAH